MFRNKILSDLKYSFLQNVSNSTGQLELYWRFYCNTVAGEDRRSIFDLRLLQCCNRISNTVKLSIIVLHRCWSATWYDRSSHPILCPTERPVVRDNEITLPKHMKEKTYLIITINGSHFGKVNVIYNVLSLLFLIPRIIPLSIYRFYEEYIREILGYWVCMFRMGSSYLYSSVEIKRPRRNNWNA
jgi:hypothetical protein